MKTAIFINTYVKMSNYDLNDLAASDVRMIAIVAQDQLDLFKAKYDAFFSEIHAVKSSENMIFNYMDYESVAHVIIKEINSGADVRIICQSEDNMLLAAQLRDQFNLPGMSYQQTLLFRDKVMMKQALCNAGIRVPKFERIQFKESVNLESLFDELSDKFSLPFLLKPTMMLGAIGVKIIYSYAEFASIYHELGGYDYQVEEFIQGKLYHCDSIRNNNNTLYTVCCEYTSPNFDFQKGKSIISKPLKMGDILSRRMIDISNEVLSILQLHNGVSHMEFFINDKEDIIFLEVAARSPGAIITPMYRKAFNIPFEDIAFKIEMDVSFTLDEMSTDYYMSGLLPISKGTVINRNNPNLLSSYEMNWYVEEGDKLDDCNNLRDKAASITVWNKNYEILLSDFNYLRDFQCIMIQS